MIPITHYPPRAAISLASRQDMVVKVDEATILGKLDPIYSFLSQYVHAQGLDVHGTQEGRDNVPRFLPKSFDIWYKKNLEAFDTVSFLYRIFFPKELASYFKGSEPELERICNVTTSLSKLMLEFKKLMDDVLTIIEAK